MEIAVFGGGCFWCTEAVFTRIQGVRHVEPGYCGGESESPTYEQVCRGDSGHVEVIRIQFDPEVVSYETLLDVFFATHDPTTPNRQGHDVGPQYQSVIFVQNEAQKTQALNCIAEIEQQKRYDRPVVTKVLEMQPFWVAEEVHHGYYNNNSQQGYCQIVIQPKINKIHRDFKELLV